jgi:carbohydrate-binding DOMON domain-containing protein
MNEEKYYEELIEGISEQMKPVLESSDQAIYIYLDDNHKVCNAKFASLLGYQSPEAWQGVKESFPETFVAGASQQVLVSTYRKAMEKMAGSNVKITWKKKMGGTVDSNVVLVPIAYEGHLFALHFVS